MESSSWLMILRGYAPDFLEGRCALESFVDSRHAQSLHAFADGLILDHRGGSALDDQTSDRFADRKRFHNREPSEISAIFAAGAPCALVKDRPFRRLHAEFHENFRLRHKLFAAIG